MHQMVGRHSPPRLLTGELRDTTSWPDVHLWSRRDAGSLLRRRWLCVLLDQNPREFQLRRLLVARH